MKCQQYIILLICLIHFTQQGQLHNRNRNRNHLKHKTNTYETVYSKHHKKSSNQANDQNVPGSMVRQIDETAATFTVKTLPAPFSDGINTREEAEAVPVEMCVFKQGYLHQMDVHQAVQGGIPPQMFGKPVFVVLNKSTMALFLNENVDQVLSTLSLAALKTPKRPQQWGNIFCFQLEQDASGTFPVFEADFEPTRYVEDGKDFVNLCADSEEKAKEWLDAIRCLSIYECNYQEFHMCAVTPGGVANLQKKIIQVEDEDDVSDNQNEQDNLIREEESKDINKELDEIQEQLRKQEAQQKRQERQGQQYLDSEIAITRKLENDKACLEKSMGSNQYMKDRYNMRLMLEIEAEKAGTVIKEAKQEIAEEIQKTSDKLTEQQRMLVNLEKQKQEEIRSGMTKLVMNQKLEGGFSKCYKLSNPYYDMLSVCADVQPRTEMPDRDQLNACMEPPNFCKQCCDHYVGVQEADLEFHQICSNKCNQVVNLPKGVNVLNGEFKMNVDQLQNLHLNTSPAPVAPASPPAAAKKNLK